LNSRSPGYESGALGRYAISPNSNGQSFDWPFVYFAQSVNSPDSLLWMFPFLLRKLCSC